MHGALSSNIALLDLLKSDCITTTFRFMFIELGFPSVKRYGTLGIDSPRWKVWVLNPQRLARKWPEFEAQNVTF